MRADRAQCMSVHALALLPPSPGPPPVAAVEAGKFAAAAAPLPLLLPIALRQLPAAEECELQNES